MLHTAAYAALGLSDWTYTAIECDEAGLPALAALREVGLASVVALVRDRARAAGLLAAADRLGMAVDLHPLDARVGDGDLLVSAVPAGAADFYAERAQRPRLGPSANCAPVSPTPAPRRHSTKFVIACTYPPDKGNKYTQSCDSPDLPW